MMNVACIAVVGLVWALGGFTPTFGDDAFLGLIGGVDALGRHWNVAQLVGFASPTRRCPGRARTRSRCWRSRCSS
jgi:Amt family ammonium transporter